MNLKTLALLLPILSIPYVDMSYAMENREENEVNQIRATLKKNTDEVSAFIKGTPLSQREEFLADLLNKQIEVSNMLLVKLEKKND